MDPDHTLLFLNLFRLEKTLKQHSGRHWTQKCFRPNALLFLSECSWDNREWTTVCWCLCHIPQTTTSYHAVKSMSWRRRKKEKRKKKARYQRWHAVNLCSAPPHLKCMGTCAERRWRGRREVKVCDVYRHNICNDLKKRGREGGVVSYMSW